MTENLMTRRDEIASAVITGWVVTGLFLDGWAHNVDKPETFFTPWHGVLYSGFLVAGLWTLHERRRSDRMGSRMRPMPPLMLRGLVLFAVGGALDMAWHEAFGIEESVEALLSPTHLVLMTAGLLLTTGTVRSALARKEQAPSWRTWAPAATGIMFATAVVAFFLQFASAFRIEDHAFFEAGAAEGDRIEGVLSVLLTNAVLLGAVAWTLRHFRPPAGTFTIVLGGTAILLAGLHAFDEAVLSLAAVGAGVAADATVARGRSDRAVLLVTPAVLWTAWFALYHTVWGLSWPAELWTGSIFLAVFTGYGLNLLAPAPSSPAHSGLPVARAAGNGRGSATGNRDRTPERALVRLLTS